MESETDMKLWEGVTLSEIPFDGIMLAGYSWGTGPEVLLVHGWGSRAAHLMLIARLLVKNGFRVTLFDGPAHGRSRKIGTDNTSNFFEFCQAVACVANGLQALYAVIGHSMGATAAAFTALGYERLTPCRIRPERLVLISPLSGIARMTEHFCRRSGMPERLSELQDRLENDYQFSMADFHLPDVIGKIESRLLIIHDEDDEEIPVADARNLAQAAPGAETLFTRGSGHQRILLNREALRRMIEFLLNR